MSPQVHHHPRPCRNERSRVVQVKILGHLSQVIGVAGVIIRVKDIVLHVVLVHLVYPVLGILGVLAVGRVLGVLANGFGVFVDVVIACSLASWSLAASGDVLLLIHALGDDVRLT